MCTQAAGIKSKSAWKASVNAVVRQRAMRIFSQFMSSQNGNGRNSKEQLRTNIHEEMLAKRWPSIPVMHPFLNFHLLCPNIALITSIGFRKQLHIRPLTVNPKLHLVLTATSSRSETACLRSIMLLTQWRVAGQLRPYQNGRSLYKFGLGFARQNKKVTGSTARYNFRSIFGF